MSEDRKKVDEIIADTIMERPYTFFVEGRQLFFYPITLGKSYLLQRLIDGLGIDKEMISKASSFEIMRICTENKETVYRILAYHTLRRKSQLFNECIVCKRIELFAKLTIEELAQLLMIALADDKTNLFTKHLGIDKENEYKQKALKAKSENSNTLSFGGKSIYGRLIDYACERYGWSYDYVVWGISLINLRLMISDSITSMYLTDKELKRCRIPKNRTFISGDDKANIEKIKKLCKG